MAIRTQVVCDMCGVHVDVAAHSLGLPAEWLREEMKRVRYVKTTPDSLLDGSVTTHHVAHYCSKCAPKHLGKRG